MFTAFDILILTILTTSSIIGLYNGMVSMCINLIGFICSILTALYLYPHTYELSTYYIKNDFVASIANIILMYALCLIFFTFIASKIIYLLDGHIRGFGDRVAGLVISFNFGAIISIAIFGTIVFLNNPELELNNVEKNNTKEFSIDDKPSSNSEAGKPFYPDWLENSYTSPYLEFGWKNLLHFTPDDILQNVNDLIRTLHQKNK